MQPASARRSPAAERAEHNPIHLYEYFTGQHHESLRQPSSLASLSHVGLVEHTYNMSEGDVEPFAAGQDGRRDLSGSRAQGSQGTPSSEFVRRRSRMSGKECRADTNQQASHEERFDACCGTHSIEYDAAFTTMPPIHTHRRENEADDRKALHDMNAFELRLSQMSRDISTTVRQNDVIISLLDRLVSITEGSAQATLNSASGKIKASDAAPLQPAESFRGDAPSDWPRVDPRTQDSAPRQPRSAILEEARFEQRRQPRKSLILQPHGQANGKKKPVSDVLAEDDSASLLPLLRHSASHLNIVHGTARTQSAVRETDQDTAMCFPHSIRDAVQCGRLNQQDSAQDSSTAFDDGFSLNARLDSSDLIKAQAMHQGHRERNNTSDEINLAERSSASQRLKGGTGSHFTESESTRSIGLANGEDQSPSDNDEWKHWLAPRKPAAAILQTIPPARYRSLKEVRQDRKQKTRRSLATIGRIPLKEYLEVKDAGDYRNVRRLGRTLYSQWLHPNIRLARQEPLRVQACINRIEYEFPIMADCEAHWKAKELILQVIDNAIDELAFHRRKKEREEESGDEYDGAKEDQTRAGDRRSAVSAGLHSPESAQKRAACNLRPELDSRNDARARGGDRMDSDRRKLRDSELSLEKVTRDDSQARTFMDTPHGWT